MTRDLRYQNKWRQYGLKPVQIWTDEEGEKKARKHDKREEVKKLIKKEKS